MFVEPSVFRAQMQYLRDNGFNSISLHELYNHFVHGHALPPRPVVITFDDGYAGVYQTAWPIMREYGFRGTLFVTDYIDDYLYMTKEQVASLIENGFELGNHSRSHRDLRAKTDHELLHEVAHFNEELETTFGVEVIAFCYPMGFYDDRVVKAVEQAGLRIAVTVRQGRARAAHGLLTLQRIPIFRHDCLQSFARKISGRPARIPRLPVAFQLLL
jgi:peptidoglycan/xylan/chitin deacetylase (PgdA/CDA1 family)